MCCNRVSGEVVEIDWTEPSDAMDMEVVGTLISRLYNFIGRTCQKGH